MKPSGEIYSQFRNKNCKVFAAPFDVRLPLPPERIYPEQIDTVVQPDLSVVCDLSKLDKHGCLGPPDWVIEIMSPSTSKINAQTKFEIYQNAGAKEYWMVYPADRQIIAYAQNDAGQFVGHRPFVEGDMASPKLFPDLTTLFPSLGIGSKNLTHANVGANSFALYRRLQANGVTGLLEHNSVATLSRLYRAA